MKFRWVSKSWLFRHQNDLRVLTRAQVVTSPSALISLDTNNIMAQPEKDFDKLKAEAVKEKDVTDLLDDLEKESKTWDKDSEIDRIMNAFRANAYDVLDLQPGAFELFHQILPWHQVSGQGEPERHHRPAALARLLQWHSQVLLWLAVLRHFRTRISASPTIEIHAHMLTHILVGVPDEDIKKTYRKKSLLIHPDKSSNKRAPNAFDRLGTSRATETSSPAVSTSPDH